MFPCKMLAATRTTTITGVGRSEENFLTEVVVEVAADAATGHVVAGEVGVGVPVAADVDVAVNMIVDVTTVTTHDTRVPPAPVNNAHSPPQKNRWRRANIRDRCNHAHPRNARAQGACPEMQIGCVGDETIVRFLQGAQDAVIESIDACVCHLSMHISL